MADNKKRIYEKLRKVNSEKEQIIFKMEYKGKVVHQKIIDLPEYAQGILDDEELSLFYFFKDMANKLEDKINEIHKKKVWDELNNGKKDGATDKGTK
jgi:hypothetical protein